MLVEDVSVYRFCKGRRPLHCFRALHKFLHWEKNHKIIDSPDGYTDRDSNRIDNAFVLMWAVQARSAWFCSTYCSRETSILGLQLITTLEPLTSGNAQPLTRLGAQARVYSVALHTALSP
jgi:hypothetical protein